MKRLILLQLCDYGSADNKYSRHHYLENCVGYCPFQGGWAIDTDCSVAEGLCVCEV